MQKKRERKVGNKKEGFAAILDDGDERYKIIDCLEKLSRPTDSWEFKESLLYLLLRKSHFSVFVPLMDVDNKKNVKEFLRILDFEAPRSEVIDMAQHLLKKLREYEHTSEIQAHGEKFFFKEYGKNFISTC